MTENPNEKKFLSIKHETIKKVAKYGLIAIGILGLLALL